MFIKTDADITIDETNQVMNIYYAKDVIGKDGGINGGDGIPDAYQVVVHFAVNNGLMQNYNGPYVLTMYDNNGSLATSKEGGQAIVHKELIPSYSPNDLNSSGDWIGLNPNVDNVINSNTN